MEMVICRALNLILYTGITAAIIYRIWWANHNFKVYLGGGGRYRAAMLTVAESGALFASAAIVVFVLTILGTSAIVAAISPTTQLAVSTSLISCVHD